MADTYMTLSGRPAPGVAGDPLIKLVDNGDGTFSYSQATVLQGGAAAPTNATTAAYSTSKVVKAAAGTLYMANGFNSGPAQFIQLHDAAALPANSAVPVLFTYASANTPWSFDFGSRGRAFAAGIVVCNSSTGPTKTIGSADIWVDAQYT